MRHAWEFMSVYNISIPDLDQGIGLHRLQDCSIMDSFLDKGIKGEIITKANKCRIHLKAFHLSDITTGDGKAITISSWNGALLDTDNRQTDVTWPNWEVIWCRPEKCCQLTTSFLAPLDSILSNQNPPPYGGFFSIDCLQSNLEVHIVGLFLEIL